VQDKDNEKSCMAYQMEPIPVNLNELKGHFCCYKWQSTSRAPSAFAELLVNILVNVPDADIVGLETIETMTNYKVNQTTKSTL